MNNLDYLEKDLEKKHQKMLCILIDKNKSILMLDASIIKDIDISFVDNNGVKQSGKIYKFASILPDKKIARIEVWNQDHIKSIYKEISKKDFLKNIRLEKDRIIAEISSGSQEDSKKNEKFIKENLENFKRNLDNLKRDFKSFIKKSFKNQSEDTIKALEKMSQEVNKKFMLLAKKEIDLAVKSLA